MHKQTPYHCEVCNSSKECYVFDKFNRPFSICMDCFLNMDDKISDENPKMIIKNCDLCDDEKACYIIDISNSPVKNHCFLCKECFDKMKLGIEEYNESKE